MILLRECYSFHSIFFFWESVKRVDTCCKQQVHIRCWRAAVLVTGFVGSGPGRAGPVGLGVICKISHWLRTQETGVRRPHRSPKRVLDLDWLSTSFHPPLTLEGSQVPHRVCPGKPVYSEGPEKNHLEVDAGGLMACDHRSHMTCICWRWLSGCGDGVAAARSSRAGLETGWASSWVRMVACPGSARRQESSSWQEDKRDLRRKYSAVHVCGKAVRRRLCYSLGASLDLVEWRLLQSWIWLPISRVRPLDSS